MLCQECLDVAHVHVQDSGAVSKRDSKLSLQQSCRFLTVLRTGALSSFKKLKGGCAGNLLGRR